MRLAYVTDFDPLDVHLQSGVAPRMTSALESQGVDVTRLFVRSTSGLRARSAVKKIVFGISGKTYIGKRHPARLAAYARQVHGRLERDPHDVVLGPHPSPLAALDCEQPIVLWTDTLEDGLIDFYPQHSNLAPETIRYSRAADQACLDRCALAIFSSDWAARLAQETYAVDSAKVKVVPWGANFVSDLDERGIAETVRARDRRICELVFIGGDWQRKGGDMAIEITSELRRIGVTARLTVIGPPASALARAPEYVEVMGFVSEATANGRRALSDRLAKSHFLLLPTAADCTPFALAEAASFAVPCITTDVGGIPTMITNGVNGQMFSLAAAASAYAEYIGAVFRDRAAYGRLAIGAYHEYRRRLNWPACAAQVKQLLETLVPAVATAA